MDFRALLILLTINQLACHPIFPFDYFFGGTQTTTPESVISDYRGNKRTDSSFDHNNLVKNATEMVQNDTEPYKESNAEFYAGVIGKLIGSVRNSFANLFDDVRKRNQHFREKSERTEAHMRKTEELNSSISVIMQHLSKNLTNSAPEAEKGDEMTRKRKRNNDKFLENDLEVGERDEIAANNLNALDRDYFAEDFTTTDATTANDFYALNSSPHDDSWYSKYADFFNAIKQTHRNKKTRKIQRLLKLILTPVLLLNETAHATNLERLESEQLAFNIVHNNRTIAQLTPFEIVRILHRESNDRIQMRMQSILKRIVYKYTRLYLIARRNFKRPNGSQQTPIFTRDNDNLQHLNSISANDISDDDDDDDEDDGDDANEVDLVDDDSDYEFSTNNGRKIFQSVESLAILMLEIFGALYALGIGFWAHLENGFFFELVD